MKCLSRSTLGVVIGTINLLFFTVIIVYIVTVLCDASSLPKEELKRNADDFTTSITLLYIILVICSVSLITSVLLILGIAKHRHTLMKPWICSAIIGVAFYILRLLIRIIAGIITGLSFGIILATLVGDLLALGLQLLLFYAIYTLYADIRDTANAQEQRGLNNCFQNPPSYAELEKSGEMYN